MRQLFYLDNRGGLYMNDISNVALLVQTTLMSNRITAIINEMKGSSHETQELLRFLNIIDE